MVRIEGTVRALEYIEANLTETISVDDVAHAAGYSLYHFIRTFNVQVGHSPYDYIMRRRLTEAADRIRGEDCRIIDVAFDFGFQNPETFSRAFRRMFGCLPTEYRSRAPAVMRTSRESITPAELEFFQTHGFPPATALEEADLSITGVGTLSWIGAPDRSALYALIRSWGEPEELYGYRAYTGAAGFYLLGLRDYRAQQRPAHFVTKTIAACTCAVFTHPGGISELEYTRRFIHQTWLPRSGFRLAGEYELERTDAGGRVCELRIPVVEA